MSSTDTAAEAQKSKLIIFRDEIFHASLNIILITILTSFSFILFESLFHKASFVFTAGKCANAVITALGTGIVLGLIRYILCLKHLKALYTFVVYAGTVVLGITETFLTLKFDTKMSPSIMQVIGDTNNASEITGFFGNYFDVSSGAIILFFAITGIAVWRLSDKAYSFFASHIKALAVCILVLCIISYAGVGKIGGLSASPSIMRLIHAVKYIHKVQANIAKMCADKTCRVEMTSNKSEVPYFVFVIGESESRHFMSLYGCQYNTTPNFCRLAESGNLFYFTDVISPRSVTALVMPVLLSFMTNESDELKLPDFDPIADVFNLAGYQTFWISNHEKITKDLSYATYMGSRCNFASFTSKIEGNAEYFSDLCLKDEVMLPVFDSYLKNNAPARDKNFFALQLMGSHIRYKDRYPAEFERFTEKDITGYTDQQKTLLAKYLNTVLYTDHFLNEIIKRLADKEAILVYASDHGEEMWQGGFQGHAPSNISRYMLEIPMVIWASDKYIEKYPQNISRIKAALNRPYMTDKLVHTLLDLAGIETKQYDPAKSVINDKFVVTERRIEGVRYEDLRK